jgi:hypothetical protein
MHSKTKGKEKEKEEGVERIDSREEMLFQQALAGIAILGGWSAILRIGGQVEYRQPSADTVDANSNGWTHREQSRPLNLVTTLKATTQATMQTIEGIDTFTTASEIGTVVGFQSAHVIKVLFKSSPSGNAPISRTLKV